MMDQKFSRGDRLRFRWQFLRFFGAHERFRLQDCLVYRIPNQKQTPRLGITIKARFSSVDRNRVKRQIRDSFRRMKPALGAYDYNFVVTAQALRPRGMGRRLLEGLPRAIGRV